MFGKWLKAEYELGLEHARMEWRERQYLALYHGEKFHEECPNGPNWIFLSLNIAKRMFSRDRIGKADALKLMEIDKKNGIVGAMKRLEPGRISMLHVSQSHDHSRL